MSNPQNGDKLAYEYSKEAPLSNFDYMASTVGVEGSSKWPFSLFGCFHYRTPDTKKCIWFPELIPKAVLGPAIGYGQVHSLLIDEEPCLHNATYIRTFGCGVQGCCMCTMFTLVLNNFVCLPPNLSPCVCCLHYLQRKELAMKYGILKNGLRPENDDIMCTDTEDWAAALCVPCNALQMDEFARLKRVQKYFPNSKFEVNPVLPPGTPKGYDTMSAMQIQSKAEMSREGEGL